ncbi:MAG: ABC transporter ATP-binding protein [Bauldia sp.]
MSKVKARRVAPADSVASPSRQWHIAASREPVRAAAAMNDAFHRKLAKPGRAAGDRPAAAASTALALDRLVHTYGRVTALAGVSLDLSAGEMVALVGHSGSGKSTLLRLIAGLERPSAGRIVIGGREVSGPAAFVPPERRGVGMMFQDYALFPHLSVLDNVRFGLHRLPGAEAEARARLALDRIGLGVRAAAYPHALSGGEQQRVALARALLPRPAILLMDEPFSNLDRGTRDLIREETAARLKDSGTTTVLVTHDPEDAMRIADRIVLVDGGRILQDGTPEELYRRPASLAVARFFTDYNEIDGVCRGGWIETAVGRFAAGGIAEGAAATVLIRPHDLRLDARPSPGGLTGTVASRAFNGDEQILLVSIAGLARPLEVHAPVHPLAVVGETVSVALTAGDVPVFPAPG